MNDRHVYLDNAATSFPKPRRALERMVETYAKLGAWPGRGSYDLSVEAAELVATARQRLARFFDAPDPNRVVFAANATDALNLAIQGIVGRGDHVVSTRLEHNSVLRPLFHLRERGWIEYDLVPFDRRGRVDPDDVAHAIRPNTRLVVICHASQVLGTVQPIAEIARECAERHVHLLIDAAQSAGQIPVQLSACNVSAIAFTGHKALLGPSGTGGLVIAPGLDIASTRFGGTGVESRSLVHTQSFPHRLEAGTLNLMGVIGMMTGLDYLEAEGLDRLHMREMAMIRRLREGLASLPRVVVHSPLLEDGDVPILTCNIVGLAPDDAGAILDADYGIAVRTGLHCAPLVHEDLGTSPHGSIRFSLGCSTTDEDVEWAIEAVSTMARST